MLEWLSVWSEVQLLCIWSSWCHCHPVISCFIKIRICLTFLVPAYPGCPGKEPLNGSVWLKMLYFGRIVLQGTEGNFRCCLQQAYWAMRCWETLQGLMQHVTDMRSTVDIHVVDGTYLKHVLRMKWKHVICVAVKVDSGREMSKRYKKVQLLLWFSWMLTLYTSQLLYNYLFGARLKVFVYLMAFISCSFERCY